MRNKLIASISPTVVAYSDFMAFQKNASKHGNRQLYALRLITISVIVSMMFLSTCVPAPA